MVFHYLWISRISSQSHMFISSPQSGHISRLQCSWWKPPIGTPHPAHRLVPQSYSSSPKRILGTDSPLQRTVSQVQLSIVGSFSRQREQIICIFSFLLLKMGMQKGSKALSSAPILIFLSQLILTFNILHTAADHQICFQLLPV